MFQENQEKNINLENFKVKDEKKINVEVNKVN